MSTDNIDGVCENLESCKLDVEKKISDKELFKHPPSIFGDCPICFERIPTLHTGSKYKTCCGKTICSACCYAPVYDNHGNKVAEEKCPFCRTPRPTSDKEILKRIEKRVELDDPIAIFGLGIRHRDGRYGFTQDYTKALEFWHRAAELGYAGAYNNIGYLYKFGLGVEVDKKKAIHYYELAAMKGDVVARCNLGNKELKAGGLDRALKHFMIAARDGNNDSVGMIKKMYSKGNASKEDYTNALQVYQEYLGEIKSPQRDKAAASDERFCYY